MKKVMFALFITFVIGAGIVFSIIMPKRFNVASKNLIVKSGVYYLYGETDKNGVIIDTDGDVTLYLDNVKIDNPDGPAISVVSARSIDIKLKSGSTSKLVGSFDPKQKGVIYSNVDMNITGTGNLDIDSFFTNGILGKGTINFNDRVNVKITTNTSDDFTDEYSDVKGIKAKNIIFNNGNFDIDSLDDGINGKESIEFKNGKYDIKSAQNGIKSTNIKFMDGIFNIDSSTNGVKVNDSIEFIKGKYDIKALRAGIKSKNDINFDDVDITLDAIKDAIHANNNININKGTFVVSSKDDGIRAKEEIHFENPNITVLKSFEALEGHKLYFKDGKYTIYADDDGINASVGGEVVDKHTTTVIEGGEFYINTGSDGIDSNGSMYISGGNIIVHGPDEGPNRVLETDTNLTITGGTIIGTECCKKPTVITESKGQNSMVIMLDHIVKGKLKVGDITFEPEKSYKSIVISSDKLETNKRYDVNVNNKTVVSYTQKKGVYARNIAKEKEEQEEKEKERKEKAKEKEKKNKKEN